MTSPTVRVGAIRLYDEVVPTLAAGRYRMRSGLAVTQRTTGTALEAPAEGSGVVEVAGPRYSLDRTEVVSCHPPRTATGAFGDRLPHVVLGRRTLPWERRFADGTPWLALLLLRTDEADLVPGTVRTGLPAPVVAAMEAADPIDGDPTATVLRVKDLSVFRAILPSRREVRLLAHVRQVNVADSALAQGDDDGWFAVVTANRLPLAPDAGAEYVACLVSLEARDDVWRAPDGSQPPPLLALQTWTFTSTGAGGTFERLVAELDLAPFGAPAAGAAPLLRADGSIGLDRTTREGSPAGAGYRGPLLGLAPAKAPTDPQDVSHAAAGELGRLLAAADGRFLREVVGWHRAVDAGERVAATARSTDAAVAALAADQPAAPAPEESAPAADHTAARAADHTAAPAADPRAAHTRAAAGRVDVRRLSADLLAAVRRRHDRPADLWQVHPAAARAAEVAARAATERTGESR